MEIHVKFDVDSAFENANITSEVVAKVMKNVAVNFIDDPLTLSDLIKGQKVLTFLLQDPDNDIKKALYKDSRYRYYDVLNPEEDDSIAVEILNRNENNGAVVLGEAFVVYFLIVNTQLETLKEEDDDKETQITLEQVVFLKPDEFVKSLFAAIAETLNDNMEDTILNKSESIEFRDTEENSEEPLELQV